ncbi:creatininase family protein [Halorubellus sp. JP-L1]|uniref:creatininase family protein n=1 Tax=Halorubellus sp. JP-L1 TaxID=2715753 RepID=UPI00140BFAF6|nr:creatininase family protein [Halorubellus sp. JP-L1]NHN41612.1 creatininase family protein [Halorubellus sp. JP-L1]
MDVADATWTDVRDADPDVGVVPVGSTEQHGPHAPLGTDTVAAEAVAAAGVEAYETADDAPVALAPAIPVGVAEEHRAFAGTLWVSPDTFRAYVRDTVESLASHGVDAVVLVNGHGGNVDALREVCARVSRDDVADAAAFTWFDVVNADVPMGHGGGRETALLRHVAPHLVREDRVQQAAEGASTRWGDWVGGVNVANDADAFTANGVVGDPRDGDAELGAAMLDDAASSLADVLRALADRD